jgi:hypothetical protein
MALEEERVAQKNEPCFQMHDDHRQQVPFSSLLFVFS